MKRAGHRALYAKNVLTLNEATTTDNPVAAHLTAPSAQTSQSRATGGASMACIAIPPGCPEIGRLEQDRAAILTGVRQGFAQVSMVFGGEEPGRPAGTAEELAASPEMQEAIELLQ